MKGEVSTFLWWHLSLTESTGLNGHPFETRTTLRNGDWPLFFFFFPELHLFWSRRCINCCTRLMRIDGPRALNFLCSIAHHTHTIILLSHVVSPASARVCIECRFQIVSRFCQPDSSRLQRDWWSRFILINASRRVCIVLSTRHVRITGELIEGRFCRGIFDTILYNISKERNHSHLLSCHYKIFLKIKKKIFKNSDIFVWSFRSECLKKISIWS